MAETDSRAVIGGIDPLPLEFSDLLVPTVLTPNSELGESWASFWFPDEWVDDFLLRPRIVIELRGKVTYEDVFGEERITNFSYDMRISRISGTLDDLTVPLKIHSFSQWNQNEEGNQAT